MEEPKTNHLKTNKRILRYLKGTLEHGLFYPSTNNHSLIGYSDSDWTGDVDDQKSTTGFAFFLGETSITRASKKQSIVTLSTCEAEYIAVNSAGMSWNMAKKSIEAFGCCTRTTHRNSC